MSRDIAVVLGTRPEIIKLAPVIQALGDRAWVVHTGQHYDDQLAGRFFRELELEAPETVLADVGGRSRSNQIAAGLSGLSAAFDARRPSVVIVQGDTNTVNAGAQAANYRGIPLIHVEAGLRSHDRDMPEEINRLITGVLADVHCAPTSHSAANLLQEGVSADRIAITGNTVVEATIKAMTRPAAALTYWFPGVVPEQYVVATVHRPENTDTAQALERVLQGLAKLNLPVVMLLHPRTRAAIDRFGLWHLTERMVIAEAIGSTDFLALARQASLIISDSGGVQEEVTVMKVPLLVVRRSTERPEAVEAGFAQLVTPGEDLSAIAHRVLEDRHSAAALQSLPSPYGDGRASERIARIAVLLGAGESPEAAVATAMQELSHPC